jgi:hypothetical protein
VPGALSAGRGARAERRAVMSKEQQADTHREPDAPDAYTLILDKYRITTASFQLATAMLSDAIRATGRPWKLTQVPGSVCYSRQIDGYTLEIIVRVAADNEDQALYIAAVPNGTLSGKEPVPDTVIDTARFIAGSLAERINYVNEHDKAIQEDFNEHYIAGGFPRVNPALLKFEGVPQGRRKRSRGAEQDPINRAARQALARGEERKAVFRRWAKAKKYNLSDPDDSRKADGAFRRMVNRKTKND